MAAFDLQTLIGYWQDFGLFSIALPFLLIFTIIFAVLQNTKILGDDKKIHAIIALVVGLISVTNEFVMAKINSFLPNVSLFIVIILMFLLLVGTLSPKDWRVFEFKWAAWVAVAFVVWALIADYIGPNLGLSNWWFGFSAETKAAAIFIGLIVVFVALFAFGGNRRETHEEPETPERPARGRGHR